MTLDKKAMVLSFSLLCACAATTAQDAKPEALFREAQEAQHSGNLALAVSKYREVIRLDPNVVAAHANLGVVLVSLGRYGEAITQYQIALAEAPDSAALRLNLGLAYFKKGDFAGGAAEFASLHKDDPNDVRVATLLGNCQMQLGLLGQALGLLEPLEKADPDSLDLQWALGNALIRSGQTLEGLKRIQKVADKGNNAEAYQLAANLYLGLTFFDEARRDAEAVIRLNPDAPKAYVVLGMVADYSGNEKEGEDEYEKALQIDAQDLQARVQLANVFIMERKLDAARKQLDHVLTLDPNSLVARYEMARVDREEGNLSTAIQELESVEQQNPEWLQPHMELVPLYYRMKRPADGDREKQIVDQLRAKEQERRGQTRIISPQVPSE